VPRTLVKISRLDEMLYLVLPGLLGDSDMKKNSAVQPRDKPVLKSCMATAVFALVCCLLLGLTPAAWAARVALVIGNSDYKSSPLKNPINDAHDMSDRLQELGFSVVLRENLKRREIASTLREFRRRIKPGDEVLFFYAGHGLQVKGVNYLPAVDAQISSEDDVDLESLSLVKLLELLDESKASVKLVFLDACRNNPFARSFRSASQGLTRVGDVAPSGTLISFATKPGSVAADGRSRNGLYTEQLLKHIGEAGAPVEMMLKSVIRDVKTASNGRQEPWSEGSLEGNFYFRSAENEAQPALPPPPAQQAALQPQIIQSLPIQTEQAFWESIKNSRDPADFSAYLQQYPGGVFRTLAQNALRRLAAPAAPANAASTADAPDPAGLVNLGWKYEKGEGVPRDEVKAVALYRQAAEAGNPYGMKNLGVMYTNGRGVRRDDAQALVWYRRAIDAGNTDAMVNLGWMFENGRGVARDAQNAVAWYRRAADSGNAMGMKNLGVMYENGLGVGKSYQTAASWYRRAAEAGNAAGMKNLGAMYANGRGVDRDDEAAVEWYRRAAQAGDAEGMVNLGWMAEKGRGIAQDDGKAAEWYQRAAEAGNATGMKNIGVMYANGRGVERDYAKAIAWYRRAVENGNTDAMVNLGWMLENGHGVARDERKAAAWYRRAAEAGNAIGMKNLGLMYANGRGVARDNQRAQEWSRKAALASRDD
jgi:TPR repeat protein